MRTVGLLIWFALGIYGSTIVANRSLADTFGSGVNAFEMEFVTVGNPGNLADTTGTPNPVGAVAYVYRIGKFEVSENMIEKANGAGGLGITKDTRGPNKPAANVSWNHAARFVNWLNTSTGHHAAYKVDGTVYDEWTAADVGYNAANPYRNSLAKYFLPSVDEWYKAAYYNGATGSYFDYPTSSNVNPLPVVSGTAQNTAVFRQSVETGPADVNQAGGLSPYGTMGQGGNVWEFEETDYELSNTNILFNHGHRGGSWNSAGATHLLATVRHYYDPFVGSIWIGFRVASKLPVALTGDYNLDGKVDAADYTVWRDGSGDEYIQGDYKDWKANFGRSLGAGSGGISVATPEPSTLALFAIGCAAIGCRRQR